MLVNLKDFWVNNKIFIRKLTANASNKKEIILLCHCITWFCNKIRLFNLKYLITRNIFINWVFTFKYRVVLQKFIHWKRRKYQSIRKFENQKISFILFVFKLNIGRKWFKIDFKRQYKRVRNTDKNISYKILIQLLDWLSAINTIS